MKEITEVRLAGMKTLIRVDFNVPLDKKYNIIDDTRIMAALPTIKHVISCGGSVILMSHLGRPNTGFEEKFSLKHIVPHLSKLLKKPVLFSPEIVGRKAIKNILKMKTGDVMLLENLRFHSEEKKGDIDFSKKLSELGDVYINDAFGTAHRAHSSTAVIAQFFPKNKCFGLLLSRELKALKKAFKKPKRPFTAIIGGAKITGKIDVINSLFKKVDNLIIGGGMAYTFVKALGGNVGMSLVEEEKLIVAQEIIKRAKKENVKLLLPKDSINASEFKNSAITNTTNINQIKKGFMGLDIGENSIIEFGEVIKRSKTIIWNGPMGVFEMSNFENGTKKIGEAVVLATQNGAFSLVGGGDSVSALKKFNLSEGVSYISTGGGALLEYLEGKDLPGIAAIEN